MALGNHTAARKPVSDASRADDTQDGLDSPFTNTNGRHMHDEDDLLADDGASFAMGGPDDGDSVEDPTVMIRPAKPLQPDPKGKARDLDQTATMTGGDREMRFGGTMGMAERKPNGDAKVGAGTKAEGQGKAAAAVEAQQGGAEADGESAADAPRQAALQRERDWLSGINDMLEKAADDFETVKDKMLRVRSTAASSHALLDVYSRILAQTEHTHQLLRDPAWQGATADAEAANAARQRAADELAEAQGQAAREAEERDAAAALQRASATAAFSTTAGGTRGRGRGRGTVGSSRGGAGLGRGAAGEAVRRGATSGSASGRGTSRIGRARGTGRARGA